MCAGGGTTDLSLVDIDNGAFTVRSTGGSSALGGRDLDAALLELVLSKAACLSGQYDSMSLNYCCCYLSTM